jgi:hypothetical protein
MYVDYFAEFKGKEGRKFKSEQLAYLSERHGSFERRFISMTVLQRMPLFQTFLDINILGPFEI